MEGLPRRLVGAQLARAETEARQSKDGHAVLSTQSFLFRQPVQEFNNGRVKRLRLFNQK